uniref:Sigma70_r1_2 domain-containing protein n=1 Tax=Macrostomum lignano TaxID=282301 RepID=A0A1I8HFA1_9PLAT
MEPDDDDDGDAADRRSAASNGEDDGEVEPEMEEIHSQLASRRPASATPAALAQSLPIAINRSAAVVAAAAQAAEDLPVTKPPADGADPPLPDSGEFKGMTDAERLYVMQAVSYRYTASVREHDQFGSEGRRTCASSPRRRATPAESSAAAAGSALPTNCWRLKNLGRRRTCRR